MQMNSGCGDILALTAGEQIFLRADLGFVLTALLPEFEDELFW